jgi:hypothetical protein
MDPPQYCNIWCDPVILLRDLRDNAETPVILRGPFYLKSACALQVSNGITVLEVCEVVTLIVSNSLVLCTRSLPHDLQRWTVDVLHHQQCWIYCITSGSGLVHWQD